MRVQNVLSMAAAAVLLSSPAMALTINIADGSVGCESRLSLVDSSNCVSSRQGDLGQNASDSAINFAGYGTLHGFVVDTAGSTSTFADAAEVTLAIDGFVKFSILNFHPIFDGTVSFGDIVIADPILNAGNSAVEFFASAGTYAFSFDAATPDNENVNGAEYMLEVASLPLSSLQLATVPLPASALLMLGGLGALGALRRNKKL